MLKRSKSARRVRLSSTMLLEILESRLFLDGTVAAPAADQMSPLASILAIALPLRLVTAHVSALPAPQLRPTSGVNVPVPSLAGASSTTAAVKLSSSSPTSVTGQNVTFTATLKSLTSSADSLAGIVTFMDGSIVFATTGVANGVAQVTYAGLASGVHAITAAYYSGTRGLVGTSAAVTQTVKRAATSTIMVVAPIVTAIGQNVTLTANVAIRSPGSSTASGTVTFKDGVAMLGVGMLDSAGRAVFTTSSLRAGKHALTAAYGGDDRTVGSVSVPVAQLVTKSATSTSVVSSNTASTFGQAVTFTATVTTNMAGAGTPTGTVTFMDGGAPLGTAAVDATGHAKFTTKALTLAVENHAITAVYNGDNFPASTSNAVKQVVKVPATSPSGKLILDSQLYTDADGSRHVTGLPILYNTAHRAKAELQSHARWVAGQGGVYFTLDIEDPTVTNDQVMQMVKWVKEAVPTMKVGVYGWPATPWYAASDYFGKMAASAGKLPPEVAAYYNKLDLATVTAAWQKEQAANDALKPVLDLLDFSSPDAYTHVDMTMDPLIWYQWQFMVDAAVVESRRLMPGKPVYTWMQPEYTPEVEKLAGKPVPAKYWGQQLQYVMDHTDGAIVFSTMVPWSSNTQWQAATDSVLNKIYAPK